MVRLCTICGFCNECLGVLWQFLLAVVIEVLEHSPHKEKKGTENQVQKLSRIFFFFSLIDFLKKINEVDTCT